METFTKLFGSLLALVYHCFDRMVIRDTCRCSRGRSTSSMSFVTYTGFIPSPSRLWPKGPRNIRLG